MAEDADLKEVRRAYRKLALQLHPDKHNNSKRSKEEFQQLNESYRHVAAALIAGHRPEASPLPTPPPSPMPSSQSAGGTHHSPPAVRRSSELRPRAEKNPERGLPRIWVHAAVAFCALLALTYLVERPVQQLPAYKPDSRELFAKSWCFISKVEQGAAVKEVAEIWSQPVCEERCSSMSAARDVSCTWDGQEFRAFRDSPAPLAAVAETASPCEIAVERPGGVSNTPYKTRTEDNCRTICQEMIRLRSREGIRCSWEGKEFLSQAITKPQYSSGAPEVDYKALPPQPVLPPPVYGKAVRPGDPVKVFPPTGPANDGVFRETCYMSVVSEDGYSAEQFPNETARSCEARCMEQISHSPTGKEIKCAFAGKPVITYVPDPMVSYMTRNPSTSGVKQGDSFMAACQIFARMGSKRAPPKADVTTEQACSVICKADFLRMPKGVEVVCMFNGDTFFQDKVKE